MDPNSQLLQRLDHVNASRYERLRMAREIQLRPEWFGNLLEIGLYHDQPIGSRAAWVAEFVCKQDLSTLFPHLDAFTAGLAGLHADSPIRAMAKICEMLAEAYFIPKAGNPAPPLSRVHRERMSSACFDWLIGPHQVAPKAYSMRTLYLLGLEETWIHGELKAILQKGYPKGSAGYQARARRILKLLEKPR